MLEGLTRTNRQPGCIAGLTDRPWSERSVHIFFTRSNPTSISMKSITTAKPVNTAK
jgi:hypothetical protein